VLSSSCCKYDARLWQTEKEETKDISRYKGGLRQVDVRVVYRIGIYV
jgi:hypothetical protein